MRGALELEEQMLQNPVERKFKEGRATMFQAIGRFPAAPMARIPWNTR
jgi:hypothetical protein